MSPAIYMILLLSGPIFLVEAKQATEDDDIGNILPAPEIDPLVQRLMDELSVLRQELVDVKDANNKVQSSHQAEISTLKDEMDQVKSAHHAGISALSQLNSAQQTGVVAFFVRIAAFTGSPTQRTVILFDDILLNIGDAYDPSVGEFTAPVAGIYVLSYEFRPDGSCGSDIVCVNMLVNGVSVSESCGHSYDSMGPSVTVQMAAGESANVGVGANVNCQTLAPYNVVNKFSGHLLYQII